MLERDLIWYQLLVAGKAINLEYFDLEITVSAKWRIIERPAAVRFPEAYIFIHPKGLRSPEYKHNNKQGV